MDLDTLAEQAPLLSVFGPPLITGPIPALLYAWMVTRRYRWPLFVFWAAVLVVDAAALFFMSWTGGMFEAGMCSWILMPGGALVSFGVLFGLKRWVYRVTEDDERRRMWYAYGIALIPLLQMAIMGGMPLLLSVLRALGLRSSENW